MKDEMSVEEKCFEAQKYFAFKVMDYTSNSFHAFESKALESLEYYMLKCLETFEEIQATASGDKLSKAYKALLIGLNTLLDIHPFKMIDYYKNDFNKLKRALPNNDNTQSKGNKEEDKSYMDISLYMSIRSLYKKYKKAPIFSQYVDILLSVKNFKVVDNTIEFLISDLLHRGFSFYYIKNWFAATYSQNPAFFTAVSEKDISEYIRKVKDLDLNTQVFLVGIKYTLKGDLKDKVYEYLERKFGLSKESTAEYVIRSGQWGKCENTYFVFQKIPSIDIHKAIQVAEQNFDTAIMTFRIVHLSTTTMKINKDKFYVAGNDDLVEYNSSKIKSATNMLWVDGKERDQLNTYMELSLSSTNEIDTIGRVITAIKNAKELDAQNQFLNSWSALEYLLYAYPRNSIIEKVREIIPKASALYYIKEKLNYFWMRLKHFCESSKNHDCLETIRLCTECTKSNSEYEYNTKKLISFFENEEWEKCVLEELSRNVILKRQLMEIDGILKKKDTREQLISAQKNKVEADLNLIYRLRNQLVHSSTTSDVMLEYIAFRLFKYVNSLLATILYYKSKNDETSISEILNSIDCTYEWYYTLLQSEIKSNQYIDIVRPPYLFLD